ncbi:MAG: hypothetical protein PHW69_04730 [Elusimicrobiaceae bacterium]|nr:hypothetical protein [Elusimicrobiaceae bacterium]
MRKTADSKAALKPAAHDGFSGRLLESVKIAVIAAAISAGIVHARYIFASVLPGKTVRIGTCTPDPWTEACIETLWNALHDRHAGGTAVYSCPLTKTPYLVKTDRSGTVIDCPNPHRHNLKRLRAQGKLVIPEPLD